MIEDLDRVRPEGGCNPSSEMLDALYESDYSGLADCTGDADPELTMRVAREFDVWARRLGELSDPIVKIAFSYVDALVHEANGRPRLPSRACFRDVSRLNERCVSGCRSDCVSDCRAGCDSDCGSCCRSCCSDFCDDFCLEDCGRGYCKQSEIDNRCPDSDDRVYCFEDQSIVRALNPVDGSQLSYDITDPDSYFLNATVQAFNVIDGASSGEEESQIWVDYDTEDDGTPYLCAGVGLIGTDLTGMALNNCIPSNTCNSECNQITCPTGRSFDCNAQVDTCGFRVGLNELYDRLVRLQLEQSRVQSGPGSLSNAINYVLTTRLESSVETIVKHGGEVSIELSVDSFSDSDAGTSLSVSTWDVSFISGCSNTLLNGHGAIEVRGGAFDYAAEFTFDRSSVPGVRLRCIE
ncbi:MAG: hypothetical protein AAF550_09855 [Myxococcota bacterium]